MIVPYHNPTQAISNENLPGLGRGIGSCIVGVGAAVMHVACIVGMIVLGRNRGDLGPTMIMFVHYIIFAALAAIAVGGFLFFQGLNILIDAHEQTAMNRVAPAIFLWGVGIVVFLAAVVLTIALPALM